MSKNKKATNALFLIVQELFYDICKLKIIIMRNKTLPSKLLDAAVNELAKLPGIGQKTALRLALNLLNRPVSESDALAHAVVTMRKELKNCIICNNISDLETCEICRTPNRDHRTVCVVETIRDVMAIENTMQYRGIYHVLGGKISPMDGIGPSDLKVDSLEHRVSAGDVDEIILALSTTMEGDTTSFYIFRKFSVYPLKITTIARGVSVGDELEYTDEVTLGKSILNRTQFSLG